MIRFALAAVFSFWALAAAPPFAPVIHEPVAGVLINPADVHMEVAGYGDPDGQAHASSDWEIRKAGPVVWEAPGSVGLDTLHIHQGDGAFVGSYAGRTEFEFDTDYVLRCRFRDAAGEASAWSERAFRTQSAGPPGQPGPNPWAPAPGFVVDVVAGGFQLPVNIAFVPNPGPNPGDPFFYVTELYGTIKVVFRNGTVGTFASGLLNFNPTGAFPGSGEQGLAGICVDPASGRVYVTLLYESASAGSPHYPKVLRFTSTDGGRSASSSTTILDMVGETQGPSHQISHISIGPDGKLYVHNGDGFVTDSALNLDSFRGKILRMNPDGSAPTDNPFYNASNGINARDYVFAYGVRNPFGGAWRTSDGAHYEIENGPSVDRLAKVVAGRNLGWTGTVASMSTFASYLWDPARAPVNGAFVQPSTFAGSGFPVDRMDRLYVTESGPTYAAGPQALGKRIVEFTLDAAGIAIAAPSTVVEYNGTGRSTAVGLAAGPDGLYFSTLYQDQGALSPIDAGAQILRLRWAGLPPGTGSGLRAEIFDNVDLTNLVVTRTDATVDFDWGLGSPAPSVAVDTFSVRWTGQVEAPATEAVTFYTVSDDGVRLWVNGQLLIDNWTDHAPVENAGTIALTAAQRYDIRMEMFENGGGAVARLQWSSASTPKQVVPSARLFPPGATNRSAAPTITPNGGTSTGPVSVTLASATSGASIRFTTDGTAPTSSVGTLYTAPFLLSSSATVKAIAFKADLGDSPAASAVFAIVPPGAGTGLTADYYDNMDFTAFRLSRTDATLNFNWGTASPDPSLGPETFSVRWTGEVEAPTSENYTFITESDDGIRLWVADVALVDNWTNHPPTENAGAIALVAGRRYAIRVDFYESGVGAMATLSWSTPSIPRQIVPQARLFPVAGTVATPSIAPNGGTFAGSASVTLATSTAGASMRYTTNGTTPSSTAGTLYAGPFSLPSSATVKAIAFKAGLGDSAVAIAAFTIAPAGSGTGLAAQYFDNADFSALRVTRTDAAVDFDWGTGSPDPSIAPDSFSVRWSGQVETSGAGTYTFYTRSDDGVRLWIDGLRIIDNWSDHAPTEDFGSIVLAAGRRVDVVMEVYENVGGAVAALSWSGPSIPKQTIPQARLFPAASSGGGLSGQYFDTPNFSGPALARIDATVDFDWGTGSPDPSIAPDSFSVRWTGKVLPRYTDTYTFYMLSDDGVRLRVNGVLIIDNWVDHAPTEDRGSLALVAGQEYDLVLEMYENVGGALARLSWSSAAQPREIVPQERLRPPSGTATMSLRSVAGDISIAGEGDFTTLQAAIDAAPAGSTVVLGPLRFYVPGGLTLKAGVSLRGSAAHRTILDGAGAATVLRMNGTPADGRVVVEGLTVTGGSTGIDAGAADVLLRHLQVVRLHGDGVLAGQAGRLEAVFLTVADNGGNGLTLSSPSSSLRSLVVTRNRGFGILGASARGSSVVANGLGEDAGAGPILFIDAESLDYREAAGSTSIDAGDPGDPFEQEPADGGRRANQGAFGNTPEAASSEQDGGACGSLGLEALLLWGLLALRGRRRIR